MRMRSTEPRGQALVEFALVLPIMALLLIGLVDLGRGLYYQTRLTAGVHAGARVGTSPSATDAEITGAVAAAALDVALEANYGCCTITPTSRIGASGQTITVTALYQLVPLTPGLEVVLAPLFTCCTGGGLTYLPLYQGAAMVIV